MAFIVSQGQTFAPAPVGPHSAVCIDVVDLGMVAGEWKGKPKTSHKCRLVWLIDELRDDGKPFLVSKQYTASLGERANLRKDLESWRGRPFTKDEADGFDVERLLSVNCLVNIQHVDRNGQTYANVTGVMPLPKTMPKVPMPTDYVRVKDRTDKHDAPVPPDDPFGNDMDEDPIPF
jgi:hypothetical protein